MKWTINHLEDLNKVAAEFWIMSETKLFCFVRTDGSREDYFCKGRRSLSGGNRRCEFPDFCPGQRVSDKKWEIPISF